MGVFGTISESPDASVRHCQTQQTKISIASMSAC